MKSTTTRSSQKGAFISIIDSVILAVSLHGLRPRKCSWHLRDQFMSRATSVRLQRVRVRPCAYAIPRPQRHDHLSHGPALASAASHPSSIIEREAHNEYVADQRKSRPVSELWKEGDLYVIGLEIIASSVKLKMKSWSSLPYPSDAEPL